MSTCSQFHHYSISCMSGPWLQCAELLLSRPTPCWTTRKVTCFFRGSLQQFGASLALLPRLVSSSSNLPRPWQGSKLPRLGWMEWVVIVRFRFWFWFWFWFWFCLFFGSFASWINSKCYAEIKQVLYSFSLATTIKNKTKGISNNKLAYVCHYIST
jgi:hypothetical protein